MAGKVRNLIERDGRYHARMVVPLRLRSILKKVELSVALGPDRRAALRGLPGAVVAFQEQLAEAERQLGSSAAAARSSAISFDANKAALSLYRRSLAFDSELRVKRFAQLNR